MRLQHLMRLYRFVNGSKNSKKFKMYEVSIWNLHLVKAILTSIKGRENNKRKDMDVSNIDSKRFKGTDEVTPVTESFEALYSIINS
jgi:hypothetical protein